MAPHFVLLCLAGDRPSAAGTDCLFQRLFQRQKDFACYYFLSVYSHIPSDYTRSCHLTTLPPTNHPASSSGSHQTKQLLIEKLFFFNFPTHDLKQKTALNVFVMVQAKKRLWESQAWVEWEEIKQEQRYAHTSLKKSHCPSLTTQNTEALGDVQKRIRKEKGLPL